ncbi:MAG: hypothetical protein U9N55_06240, partial [candidate division Zixibacteria bacterium]|nr:hypothetical protein [candidate division Zixibacteria bacterium]
MLQILTIFHVEIPERQNIYRHSSDARYILYSVGSLNISTTLSTDWQHQLQLSDDGSFCLTKIIAATRS